MVERSFTSILRVATGKKVERQSMRLINRNMYEDSERFRFARELVWPVLVTCDQRISSCDPLAMNAARLIRSCATRRGTVMAEIGADSHAFGLVLLDLAINPKDLLPDKI